MKRAFLDLDQCCESDEDNYQTLFLNHSQVLKELVSKKRKLYAAKRKRDTLSAEVRFLRKRHKYLLRIRSSDVEDCQSQIHEANVQRRKLLEIKRSCAVDDAPLGSPCLVSVSNPDPMSVAETRGKGRDQITPKQLRIEQTAKELVDKCRRAGKRKSSWHYNTSLETIKEEREEDEQEELISNELLKVEKMRNRWNDERRGGQIRCL